MKAFAILLLVAAFGVVDTTILTTDHDHPTATAFYPTPDETVTYAVLEVEAAGLRPFCLTLERSPRAIWTECFRAGYIKRAIPWQSQQGRSGEALSLTVQSPIAGDRVPLSVLVHMVISETTNAAPDGGHHP